ncbi:MAG: hypothetical protein PGN34_10570 [Methylobacterium frigidaeris]
MPLLRRVLLPAGSAAVAGALAAGLLLCLPSPGAAVGPEQNPAASRAAADTEAVMAPLPPQSCLRLRDIEKDGHCDKDGRKVRVVGR